MNPINVMKISKHTKETIYWISTKHMLQKQIPSIPKHKKVSHVSYKKLFYITTKRITRERQLINSQVRQSHFHLMNEFHTKTKQTQINFMLRMFFYCHSKTNFLYVFRSSLNLFQFDLNIKCVKTCVKFRFENREYVILLWSSARIALKQKIIYFRKRGKIKVFH